MVEIFVPPDVRHSILNDKRLAFQDQKSSDSWDELMNCQVYCFSRKLDNLIRVVFSKENWAQGKGNPLNDKLIALPQWEATSLTHFNTMGQ